MTGARYESVCGGCRRPIDLGDPIVKVGEQWRHERCARRAAGEPRTTWADAMLAEIPGQLRPRVYRALSRVLHPDAGGDLETMQQLTAAWDRGDRR